MQYPDTRLLIFAKAPESGQVKTRLIESLGAQGAADLYTKMVRHTVQQAVKANLCPIELWCAPDTKHPLFYELSCEYDISLYAQQGQDLGARMAHAAASALTRCDQMAIIGTDCPAVTADDLAQACAALVNDHDVVLGGTEDGGYYLIGFSVLYAALFENIKWGSEEVLPVTRQKIAERDLDLYELPLRWDVDTPEDVVRLDW